MYSLNSVKLRAKSYRSALQSIGHSISVGESLEFVSIVDGFKDWNAYSGSLKKTSSLLPIPVGWYVHGDSRESFEVGLSPTVNYKGSPCATIRSTEQIADTKSFVTLMQTVSANEYIGWRICLNATIMSKDCDGAVTIWLRIDGSSKFETLAFDNMEDRDSDGPISGSTAWTTRSIVLDVPDEAKSLNYGFYLRGNGEAFAGGFSLTSASKNQQVTSKLPRTLEKPTNLNFTQTP